MLPGQLLARGDASRRERGPRPDVPVTCAYGGPMFSVLTAAGRARSACPGGEGRPRCPASRPTLSCPLAVRTPGEVGSSWVTLCVPDPLRPTWDQRPVVPAAHSSCPHWRVRCLGLWFVGKGPQMTEKGCVASVAAVLASLFAVWVPLGPLKYSLFKIPQPPKPYASITPDSNISKNAFGSSDTQRVFTAPTAV